MFCRQYAGSDQHLCIRTYRYLKGWNSGCPAASCPLPACGGIQYIPYVRTYSRGHKNLSEFTLLYFTHIRTYIAHVRELLLKIMAVLVKVSTLRKQLPSVIVDPCLYYCCTTHQALAALRSLCTEGCARTARSTCVGICNVIHVCEFIWTAAILLCAQIRTGFYDFHCHVCMYDMYHSSYFTLYVNLSSGSYVFVGLITAAVLRLQHKWPCMQ